MLESLSGPAAALLRAPRPVAVPRLPLAAEALLLRAMHRESAAPLVWIADCQASLDAMHRNFRALAQGPDQDPAIYFPPRDAAPGSRGDTDIEGHRLHALRAVSLACTPASRSQPLILTTVQALMQQAPDPASLDRVAVSLREHEEADLGAVAERLDAMGYRRTVEVREKSEFTVKGGLLDAWSPDSEMPVRIEWFGQKIESLRTFDPLTQVSVRKTGAASLLPATEPGTPAAGLLDFLPGNTVFWWSDMPGAAEHAGVFAESLTESGAAARFATWEELAAAVSGRAQGVEVQGASLEAAPVEGFPAFEPVLPPAPAAAGMFEPDRAGAERRRLIGRLCELAGAGWDVAVFLDTSGELEHFRENLPEGCGVQARVGAVSEGFMCPAIRLALVCEGDIYGRKKLQVGRYDPRPRKPGAAEAGDRIGDLSQVEPGELVVHADHGIGRYLGLFEIAFEGRTQEVISVEYADNARLHVPVSQSHLLSRYTGVSRHHITLHRLGGKRWAREKSEADRAVADLAASLIETQALRETLKGRPFAADNVWQREFEAAFPYRETPDQQDAIADVKRCMEAARPMDLLVCGDAGYGKTEVAMRAAFKAVMDGAQVAVLVPTTVLAQQHFSTFTDRMAPFPVRIGMLSRFCSPAERRDVLAGTADGSMDIVIGTHALIGSNVKFRDLGLVIIDEEQRFGVRHKEWLKKTRAMVDVLTMTATPIPRTLYLSMTGARDMSLIQTAPRERISVETVVSRNDDNVVRGAVLRELNRGGQAFYLHNRVMTIERAAARLRELVPEARIAVAHGQMPAAALSRIVRGFISGDSDVLLCTTIIESGTDIPRANTILIDRADRFGLSELYQLRGRVGRGKQKGYAYLLLPHGRVEALARKRIEALMRHSELGAGFHLALRDLEIRGAGNLLGPQQSGHINAVGFGLYCQLLRRSVAKMKGDKVPEIVETEVVLDFITLSTSHPEDPSAAAIPYSYIEDEPVRVGVYRRMAEAADPADVKALRAELGDRFGRIPPALDRFLKICELRTVCAAQRIRRVEAREGKAMFEGPSGLLMKQRKFPRLSQGSPDACLNELLRLARTIPRWST